jgi:2-polyprenyl-3-methyl-5-hydroxy-6-metoxy-1,4-benzoquinol methylase
LRLQAEHQYFLRQVGAMINERKRPTAGAVGLRDWVAEGWFNGKTGELTQGVRVRATDTVVDVGCGDGAIIGFCARQGAEVYCIDRDAERLATTEAKVRDSPARAYHVVLSHCDPIPLDDAIGDLVICTEVLEHVPDPRKFMDELVRITRPGAQLLITVPEARSEQFVAATAPPEYFQEPNHIRLFSAEDFRELVAGAGLEIEDQQFRGCFWSMYWPLAWLTSEPGTGLPTENAHPITEHWTRLWEEVQQHPQGHRIRDALNQLLPKSQSIVARKPK